MSAPIWRVTFPACDVAPWRAGDWQELRAATTRVDAVSHLRLPVRGLTNPSLRASGGTLDILLRPATCATTPDGAYTHPARLQASPRFYRLRLRDTTPPTLVTSQVLTPPPATSDVRWWGAERVIMARREGGAWAQVAATLHEDGTLTPLATFQSATPECVTKNWVAVDADTLLCTLSPLTLCRLGAPPAFTVHQADPTFKGWRNSSNVVAVGGVGYMWVHAVGRGSRYYIHALVRGRAEGGTFTPAQLSRPVVLQTGYLEFVTSHAMAEDGTWRVAYGRGDQDAWIATLPHAALLALFDADPVPRQVWTLPLLGAAPPQLIVLPSHMTTHEHEYVYWGALLLAATAARIRAVDAFTLERACEHAEGALPSLLWMETPAALPPAIAARMGPASCLWCTDAEEDAAWPDVRRASSIEAVAVWQRAAHGRACDYTVDPLFHFPPPPPPPHGPPLLFLPDTTPPAVATALRARAAARGVTVSSTALDQHRATACVATSLPQAIWCTWSQRPFIGCNAADKRVKWWMEQFGMKRWCVHARTGADDITAMAARFVDLLP
jgi:hypothetical protein